MKSNYSITTLITEINWLSQVINQVIGSYLMHDGHEKHWLDIPLPDLTKVDNAYANSIKKWNLNTFDRLALALTMAPHLLPQALDVFFGRNKMYDRGFTEFGGILDTNHSGFLPTGQTLTFLITANNPEYREALFDIIGKESLLIKEQVIELSDTEAHIPNLNGILSMNDRWFHYFLTGEELKIEHSTHFPAQKITTKMEWEDVVLNNVTRSGIDEINSWLFYNEKLMHEWGLEKIIKPGYRALFYGPPGTGKTLTATLLGKATNRDVYRIDLSMIVSKYIGETEKNLARVFDAAQHKDWILFFDEADALFGRRTTANSSNDRHANQQTSYLLQRIESFPGTIILASNLKANMDEAFTRRFQAMIHFTMPSPKERYQLWKNAFSGVCSLDEKIDLKKIATDYELTGGSIINVLRYCALSVVRRNDNIVDMTELINGIRREFKKENKTLSTTY
ncbi:ATP-binding protein [Psychroserpens sp.]|uniref:ATP-binding protein n=1 Tax=Psychroserpens sp. TaxID=2020870 RepID=UPI002B2786C4|nr:ATP-binding protein [Psychroserpens sp.]